MLSRLSRIALAWLAGSAIAYALASVAHTQTVLAGLTALDVRVPFAERVATTAGDLVGLWVYGVVIGVGLALGLIVMRVVPRRVLPLPATARAILAGALSLATILGAMKLAFAFTPIASAREPIGFALQCLAGAAGGWVYGWLRGERSAPGTGES